MKNFKPIAQSVIISLAIMFGISYFWHGYFLNDFVKLYTWEFPVKDERVFYGVIFLFYFAVSMGMTFMYLLFNNKNNFLLRGVLVGMLAAITIQIAIRFSGFVMFNTPEFSQLVVELCIQMLEQGLGGLAIAFIFKQFYANKLETETN